VEGLLTNDTLHALRAYCVAAGTDAAAGKGTTFRSRRLVPPSAEGRWTLVPRRRQRRQRWATAMANQLLVRHGIVTRDVTAIEQLPGGFSSMYPVLRRLEETGRIRRGYFVAGLGAAQFAQPGAVDLLRDMRDDRDEIVTVTISATDPANPYGVLIPWPMTIGADSRRCDRGPPARASCIVNGRAAAWIGRGDRQLIVCCRMTSPSDRGSAAPWRASCGDRRARTGGPARVADRGDQRQAAIDDPASQFLLEAGFASTAMGLQLRVPRRPLRLQGDAKEADDA
jgi:ATP-dependent Lhr-like helicase